MTPQQELGALTYVQGLLLQAMMALGLASLPADKARAFKAELLRIFEHITDPAKAKAQGNEEFAEVVRTALDLTMRGVADLELQFRTSGKPSKQ